MSKNTALNTLNSGDNQLTAEALNVLFGTLHSNTIPWRKSIQISGNPGAATCNRSIAEGNGWTVY